MWGQMTALVRSYESFLRPFTCTQRRWNRERDEERGRGEGFSIDGSSFLFLLTSKTRVSSLFPFSVSVFFLQLIVHDFLIPL